MKSRWRCWLLVLLLCGTLIGCTQKTEAEPPAEHFYVVVEAQADERFHGLHMEYALAGDATGGGVVTNADGSEIQPAQRFYWEFLPEDFPEGADLSGFSVAYYVVLADGTELPCGDVLAFSAAYGEEYHLLLTGNARDGFALTAVPEQTR